MGRYALWIIIIAFLGINSGDCIPIAIRSDFQTDQELQNLISKLELPATDLRTNKEGDIEFIFHKDGANPFDVNFSVRNGQITRVLLCGGRDSREETFGKTKKFLENVLQLPPFNVNSLLARAIAASYITYWQSNEHYKYEKCGKCEGIKNNHDKCENCRVIATDYCDEFGIKIFTCITKKHYQIVIWPGKRILI